MYIHTLRTDSFKTDMHITALEGLMNLPFIILKVDWLGSLLLCRTVEPRSILGLNERDNNNYHSNICMGW